MDKTFLDSNEVKLFKLYITNLKWTAALIKQLADVVKAYGNKVYNVRFDKLLQAELDKYVQAYPIDTDKWQSYKVYITVREFTTKKIDISLYGLKNSIYIGKDTWNNDKYISIPSDFQEFRIAYHWTDYPTLYSFTSDDVKRKEELYHSVENSPDYFYIDDNFNIRIHANNLAALLIKEAEDQIKQADQLDQLLIVGDDGLTEVERDKKEYQRIKLEAEVLRDKLPYAEREFFDIKAYAQWS